MTAPVLLDVTRPLQRRLKRATPSGIDRVCESYVAHFTGRALAVLQMAGLSLVLDKSASDELLALLGEGEARAKAVKAKAGRAKASGGSPAMAEAVMPESVNAAAMDTAIRRDLLGQMARFPLRLAPRRDVAGGLYLNVGHSGYDRAAHRRFIEGHGLRPLYLLHDLIPLTHPQVTKAHKTKRHRQRVITALTKGCGIVVTTQSSRAELSAFAEREGWPLPPILVASIAAQDLRQSLGPFVDQSYGQSLEQTDGQALEEGPAPRPTPQGADTPPYFLAIGTLERRKNIPLLLRAWGLLAQQAQAPVPQLVLAGSWGLGAREIKASLKALLREQPQLRSLIHIRNGLTDGQMATLLRDARALLLPSFAEGYGLPMVEALMMQVPVIASDQPVFREIGQGIPTLMGANDAQGWADMICDFTCKAEQFQRQMAAITRFNVPRWDSHFDALESWMDRLALGQGAEFQNNDAQALQSPAPVQGNENGGEQGRATRGDKHHADQHGRSLPFPCKYTEPMRQG